jgi:hypothetical protein
MRKHPSLISVLTIAPWPIVKQGGNFVITGKLTDAVTLQPLPSMPVAFKAVFIPYIFYPIPYSKTHEYTISHY